MLNIHLHVLTSMSKKPRFWYLKQLYFKIFKMSPKHLLNQSYLSNSHNSYLSNSHNSYENKISLEIFKNDATTCWFYLKRQFFVNFFKVYFWFFKCLIKKISFHLTNVFHVCNSSSDLEKTDLSVSMPTVFQHISCIIF